MAPTPHIAAQPDDFAEVVLLPGDPLRARHIAETHLADAELVTSIRNMEGYTGTFQGTRVSVMGTGMGIPSALIYATELVRKYGVRRLIRVGSCGGVGEHVRLRDILIASGAGTDSHTQYLRSGGYQFPLVADFTMLRRAVEAAEELGVRHHVGPIFSSDQFYHPDEGLPKRLQGAGVLGVEMEAAGLYGLAASEGVAALAIATVSDHLFSEEELTPEERQTTVDEMVSIALQVAIS